MIRTFFKREDQINHTYKIELTLNNVSKQQCEKFTLLLDILEKEGITITEYKHEND
jgi:hypothetical protein